MQKNQNIVDSSPEFDNHSFVLFLNDSNIGLRGFIAIHRKKKENIPSFGATRIWHYDSDEEAVNDALRLSRIMSYKSALAGLPYTGAKGVIMLNSRVFNDAERKKILETYAENVNCLNGQFITGTDVGLTQKDLQIMKKKSKYIVGFNDNSTEFTSLGIFYAIKLCLNKIFGNENITGRSFAIQGLGKIGSSIIDYIYNDADKIFASDTDRKIVHLMKKKYPKIKIVEPSEIHKQKVDVFSPCALSDEFNEKNVNKLNCKIICGAGNNQLKNEKIGEYFYENDIVYVPDYVANAGGLISIVSEIDNGGFSKVKVEDKIDKIFNTTKQILEFARDKQMPTNFIANQLAEQIINENK